MRGLVACLLGGTAAAWLLADTTAHVAVLVQERKDNQTADEETPAAKKSGIRMGRIKAKGDKGTFSQVEVEQLRGFIQKLCQSTNPLGKCMDYVHEDVEMMKSELSSWTAEYKRRQTVNKITRLSVWVWLCLRVRLRSHDPPFICLFVFVRCLMRLPSAPTRRWLL